MASNQNDYITGYATADVLYGLNGRDTLDGRGGDDTLYGGVGADFLQGGGGDDKLLGQDGDDSLSGDDGDDTLDGGAGYDTLDGGVGHDTYLFGRGSGRDRISSYQTSADDVDVIQLGSGVLASDITLVRLQTFSYRPDSLVIRINGTSDSLQVDDFFSDGVNEAYRVDQIVFADGSRWDFAAITSKVIAQPFAPDVDLRGTEADDVLKGGTGNDRIDGVAGSDTLDGGAGSDVLRGGAGADTYLFGLGSGRELIYNGDSDMPASQPDTLLIAPDVSPADVTLTRGFEGGLDTVYEENRTSGLDNLVISIEGTDDRVEVVGFLDADGLSSNALEFIKFADGTVWDLATVKQKVLVSTPWRDRLTGFASPDMIRGGDGDDVVDGQGGDDTLQGGAGFDHLKGGDGADTYLFGPGSGVDSIDNFDNDPLGSSPDSVLLASGVTASSVALARSGSDLRIHLIGTDDTLWVDQYFVADGMSAHGLEYIKFSDGTIWDLAEVKSKVWVPTAGNIYLVGYASDDVIQGSPGNDYLIGIGGNDILSGGSGDDMFWGGEGSDRLFGEAGRDTLQGGDGNDAINGGIGDDLLYGESGDDTLDGGAGVDELRGGAGVDTYLFGHGSGQDIIYNGDGSDGSVDVILLGAGISSAGVVLSRVDDDLFIGINGVSDVLKVASYFREDGATGDGHVNVSFQDGTVWDSAAIKLKTLQSSVSNDWLIGYSGSDTISGGYGNDSISGRSGNDSIDGGPGADILAGDAGNDSVGGGEGDDKLDGAEDDDRLYGGVGDDRIMGGLGDDTLDGGPGDDVLEGGGGNDSLDGGSGSDHLSGGPGADTYVFGLGSGQDYVFDRDGYHRGDMVLLGEGIAPDDITLTLTDAGLTISVNGTNDSLQLRDFGSDGWLYRGPQFIQFANGSAWDFDTASSKVVTLTTWPYNDVNGTSIGDSVRGGSRSDRLYGHEGDDTLDGGAGDDLLDGGAGNDTYSFGRGSGNDSIVAEDYAAGGFDVIELSSDVRPSDLRLEHELDILSTVIGNVRGILVLHIRGTTDSLRVGENSYDQSAFDHQVEQIRFSDGTTWGLSTIRALALEATVDNDFRVGYDSADVMSGLSGNDWLSGGAGEDILFGGDGADVLVGDDGNDSLQGQIGNDDLRGGTGDDTLDGGPGDDLLSGGAGDDAYVFGKGSGRDIIEKYATGVNEFDVIRLSQGVLPGDVTLIREYYGLALQINGTGDRLRVDGYFDSFSQNDASSDSFFGFQVRQIEFADGTTWDLTTIKTMALNATTDSDSYLIGYAATDVISGLDGNDTIEGKEGDDTLVGNGGNDTLYGGEGADVLDGGAGDDRLSGGTGDDTYLFGLGYGVDRLEDGGYEDRDSIQFGAGILPRDVTVSHHGDNLGLRIRGTSDELTVVGSARIETIKFADGTIWDTATITALSLRPGGEDETLIGGVQNDTWTPGPGDDTIDGGAGLDMAVYSGSLANYKLTLGVTTTAPFTVTDLHTAVDGDGADSFTNLERLKFADRSLALDVGASQNAGQAALLVGAVLGKGALAANPGLTGAVIGLLDSGLTLQVLSAAVMRLPIWGDLANGGAGAANSTQIATYLLNKVYGTTQPDSAALASAVVSLEHDPQGDFLWLLAQSQANQAQVDLVGLAQTGLQFV